MLYYRFRPFSELSIKELIYNEIFFTSTDECNDPFDSKAFYEFGDQVDYWGNILKIVGDKIGGLDERLINAIAKRISNLCPMTYDDALNLDITQICFDMMLQKNAALFQSLAVCFNQFLKLYKPEPSYFACFSKVNSEPLMWSHYASQHQGFCLIFKPIDGKLRQFPTYERRSIRRKTPNSLAPDSNYVLCLVPTRCVGMKSRRAAPRVVVNALKYRPYKYRTQRVGTRKIYVTVDMF
jgi:hypothetical protein